MLEESQKLQTEYEYWAFISYSHADKEAAEQENK
jgi:hypothetical protein